MNTPPPKKKTLSTSLKRNPIKFQEKTTQNRKQRPLWEKQNVHFRLFGCDDDGHLLPRSTEVGHINSKSWPTSTPQMSHTIQREHVHDVCVVTKNCVGHVVFCKWGGHHIYDHVCLPRGYIYIYVCVIYIYMCIRAATLHAWFMCSLLQMHWWFGVIWKDSLPKPSLAEVSWARCSLSLTYI